MLTVRSVCEGDPRAVSEWELAASEVVEPDSRESELCAAKGERERNVSELGRDVSVSVGCTKR